MRCIQRNIIHYVRTDICILGLKLGIGSSVADHIFVGGKVLSNRLPGQRPVIPGLIVAKVDITSRLVKLIKYITKDTSVCTGLCETVTSRIVGYDGTILRRSQIVGPGSRCIRSLDHILFCGFVKKTVTHRL